MNFIVAYALSLGLESQYIGIFMGKIKMFFIKM